MTRAAPLVAPLLALAGRGVAAESVAAGFHPAAARLAPTPRRARAHARARARCRPPTSWSSGGCSRPTRARRRAATS